MTTVEASAVGRVEAARGAIRDRVDRFFHIFRTADLHREQADGRECCNKTMGGID
jgi:hypothetical protein